MPNPVDPNLAVALSNPGTGADLIQDTVPLTSFFQYTPPNGGANFYTQAIFQTIPDMSTSTGATGITNSAVPIGFLFGIPWVCKRTGIIAKLAVGVQATGGAGSVFRFGLYNADQVGVFPTSLLFGSPSHDGTSVAVQVENVGIQVQAGQLYFGAYTCGVGAPTIRAPAQSPQIFYGVDQATMSNAFMPVFRQAFAFAALPATWPIAATTFINVGSVATNLPMIGYAYQ